MQIDIRKEILLTNAFISEQDLYQNIKYTKPNALQLLQRVIFLTEILLKLLLIPLKTG